MNSERLHALLAEVLQELKSDKTPELLENLVAALRRVVEQPNQPEPQQKVSELRTQLREALGRASSDGFSPGWRQHLEELGIAHLLGAELLQTIESVFTANEITPASAADELEPVRDDLAQLLEAVQQAVAGLGSLGVGREELEPGAYELGILVPRHAVDSELAELGNEFIEIERILLPFVELATGSRPPLQVRAIGSSDFTAFLDALPAAAACVAVAVERVIALYKNVLELRRLRNELSDHEVPPEALEGLKRHVEATMEQGLERVVEELKTEFPEHLDGHRRNELTSELLRSLRKLANRIDAGYSVEVRHEPLPEPEEDAEDPVPTSQEDLAYSRLVRERLPGLRFIKLDGPPILQLPEGPDDGHAGKGSTGV
ncbi:hypothetical protein [Egicoccus sp. AB-alg2]|uniref:hypothetical protein n=1 Tax=Egicoccus sp. AB-alg2 TaxID=3242693 RepID=UPI00359EE24A